jgi:hypothetical protein
MEEEIRIYETTWQHSPQDGNLQFNGTLPYLSIYFLKLFIPYFIFIYSLFIFIHQMASHGTQKFITNV